MTAEATGEFTVTGWDESTYADLGGGAKLTKARVSFGFSGDLEAEGGWEALMCYRADGSAIFVGFQHTSGKLAGRNGSFVLRADGTFEGGEARTDWHVVDGTGTGDLQGLRGNGTATSTGGSGGTYTFSYELD
jgi:hypothetical protein